MKINRCYDLPPLYDIEVEMDCVLHASSGGFTAIVTSMKMLDHDLYDHPVAAHADFFLRLAHLLQGLAEADDSIVDELLDDADFPASRADRQRRMPLEAF